MFSTKTVHTYLVIIFITIVALYVIQRFDISYPITIRTSQVSSELSVVGEGKMDVTPDTATIDVGISVNNESTASSAQKKIDEVNNRIIDAMKSIGIKKENIQTSNYSIYPNMIFDDKARQETVSGYNGSVSVSIKVSDTKLAPSVVDMATKAGANQIQGVRFTIDHPEEYREKVRDMAIENARQQAEKLAKSLGIKLGKVTNISENSGSQPPILYANEVKTIGLGGGGDSGPQFEPGTQTITSSVTLYFDKK